MVTQSNFLVEARYNLSLVEQKIVKCISSLVEPQDQEFKEYGISAKHFSILIGSTRENAYMRLKESCEKLVSNLIRLRKPDGSFFVCSWASSAEYVKDSGIVKFCFDPKLKPFMLELKKCFTTYRLTNILKLESSYSIRIYELLKQYEPLGERRFALNELKQILGVEKQYGLYGDFKRKVLKPAKKELKEKCDIKFEFFEIKEGRKVVKLDFIIQENKAITEQEKPAGLSPREIKQAYEIRDKNIKTYETAKKDEKIKLNISDLNFITEDLSKTSLRSIYDAANGDINKIHNRYECMKASKTKVENVVGWLIDAVKKPDKDYKPVKSKYKRKDRKADSSKSYAEIAEVGRKHAQEEREAKLEKRAKAFYESGFSERDVKLITKLSQNNQALVESKYQELMSIDTPREDIIDLLTEKLLEC
jgi:plasmid replication initiation protein